MRFCLCITMVCMCTKWDLVGASIIVEFINLVSSESNEVCNKEERRTIAPEHVLKALGVFLKLLNCCIAKVFMQIRSNLCLINYVISSLKCCFLFCILNFNFYLVSFYVSLLSICEVPVILEIFFFVLHCSLIANGSAVAGYISRDFFSFGNFR